MADALANRVLVAINGTDSSIAAFEYGLCLGRGEGELKAVLVEDLQIPDIMSYVDGPTLSQFVAQGMTALRAAGDELQRRITRMARQQDVPATIYRSQGNLLKVVAEESRWCSMLVLGKGAQLVEGGLLGSDAEFLVRHTHKPVILSPETFSPPTRVLAAYAAKSLGSLLLSNSVELATRLGVELAVLTVDDDPKEREHILASAREELADVSVNVSFLEAEGDPAEEIVRHCDAGSLLAMGAYGSSRLYRFLLGSTTARLMRMAPGPVFITAKMD